MKRSFAVLLDFNSLDHFIQVHKELLLYLSKRLKKIYFINIPNNNFVFRKNKIIDKKKFVLLNPKSLEEFEDIIRNKNFLVKNSIATGLEFFKVLRIIKKYNVPQIMISNIGFLPDSVLVSKNEIIKSFFNYFRRKIIHRFYIFLATINLMPKIDLRFVSSKLQKKYFEQNKKKLINKLLFNQHFSQYKELMLVNSRAYDIFKKKRYKNDKKKTVLLDIEADHYVNMVLDGKVIKKNKKSFYKKLNYFLNWYEKKLNTKITICTHPAYNLKERKNVFKKYKVVQGKTKEYIQRCSSVLLFHSSAVTEAFFLKKNIINLETKMLGKHWERCSNLYPKYAGIMKINIDNKNFYTNLNLNKLINKKNEKYFSFRNNFLIPDGNKSGFKKIYETIKSRYSVI